VPVADDTSWYGVRCVYRHGADDPEATSYEALRDSPLSTDDHLDRFFDTGRERQQPAG